MKNLLVLFAALLLVLGSSYAQGPYRHLTIRQMQEVSEDSLNVATSTNNINYTLSHFLDDTAWVSGVVVVPPRDPVTQQPIFFTGDRWRLMLQDPNEPEWGAFTIVSEDTTLSKATNGIDVALEGDSISVLGIVSEFASLTQINMLRVGGAFEFHGTGTLTPPPTHQVSDFMIGAPPSISTTIFNPGEKFESQLMWIRNVTLISKLSDAEFQVADAAGNVLVCDSESNEIFNNPDLLPPVGTVIDSMLGVMGFNSSGRYWEFFVRYFSDIYASGVVPPEISDIRSSVVDVGTSDHITVSAEIVDNEGLVASSSLHYQVNDLAPVELAMINVSGSTWSATIPAVDLDSAFVNYFIAAADDQDNSTVTPFDTTANRLFFFVLNRPLSIRELQFTPYLDDNSGYENLRVSVEGIITADRSDIGSVFLQDGNSPWSGIHLNFRTSDDTLLLRGDRVTVTGRVAEFVRKTQIDSAEFVPLSSGNPLPEPAVVTTDDVRTGGSLSEQFESMLVQVQDVYVVKLNADEARGSNFGEWLVSENMEAATGLRIDDLGVASGNVSFDNDLTIAPIGSIQLELGDFFSSITGVLDYSFNDFSLEPRSDTDFVGYTPVTFVERDESVVPVSFVVHQNYPNPFNPSTTIRYEIPHASHVTVKIYSVLGQEVATLVDGVQEAGGYVVTFDSRKLASGVYFYRVAAGDFGDVKKMLLLK